MKPFHLKLITTCILLVACLNSRGQTAALFTYDRQAVEEIIVGINESSLLDSHGFVPPRDSTASRSKSRLTSYAIGALAGIGVLVAGSLLLDPAYHSGPGQLVLLAAGVGAGLIAPTVITYGYRTPEKTAYTCLGTLTGVGAFFITVFLINR